MKIIKLFIQKLICNLDGAEQDFREIERAWRRKKKKKSSHCRPHQSSDR